MRILVQKFGGSSVANLECMRQVLVKVRGALDQGYKVVVTLSARAGETNRLLALAGEWFVEPDLSELDVLLTTGEQESVALFSMLLKQEGINARSMLCFQIPIYSDDNYSQARITDINADAIRRELETYDVIVVAGFQGITEGNRLTTLGRGGGDTSAVAVAAALGSVECEIYTDVDGVYSTDPRICRDAQKIDRISYDEMLEMASMGAKVLQIRAVEFAKKYKVPVRVRSTFGAGPGTVVTQEEFQMENEIVSSIAYDKDQARVTLRSVTDKPGVASGIFGPLAAANIVVDMIVQNPSRDGVTDMTFTVPHRDLKKTLEVMDRVRDKIGAKEIAHDLDVAKVSVIGVGMRNHSGVASQAFEALHNEGINILMISTSEIKITCLIEDRYAELAVRTLHEAFGLGKKAE